MRSLRNSTGTFFNEEKTSLASKGRTNAGCKSKVKIEHVCDSDRSKVKAGLSLSDIVLISPRKGLKVAQLEYLSICELENLTEVDTIKPNTLIALAVKIGKARLIDNYLVEG